MKVFLIALMAVALITGCATYDPYTGDKEASKAGIGAGVGAGIGAVIAYLDNRDEDSRKRNQRILAAAAGGAAVGGGVGYYMDAQEAKLRKQLRETGVRVEREGNHINLVMPGNITFATDSANIADDFFPVLNSVALILKEYNRTLVVVGGHTDSDGSEQYNKSLSQNRAAAVTVYLATQGVDTIRLETVGFGESQPIADNSTAEGKQANRRVELTLLPVEEDEA